MSIKKDEELCNGIISHAFLHSFHIRRNIPKAARENQSEYRLYDSYYNDINQYKKITECCKKFPKMVEQDRDWLEDEIQQIYPEVLIRVNINKDPLAKENFCIDAKWSKYDNDILQYRGLIYNTSIKMFNKIL